MTQRASLTLALRAYRNSLLESTHHSQTSIQVSDSLWVKSVCFHSFTVSLRSVFTARASLFLGFPAAQISISSLSPVKNTATFSLLVASIRARSYYYYYSVIQDIQSKRTHAEVLQSSLESHIQSLPDDIDLRRTGGVDMLLSHGPFPVVASSHNNQTTSSSSSSATPPNTEIRLRPLPSIGDLFG